jgi:hypothetical protein
MHFQSFRSPGSILPCGMFMQNVKVSSNGLFYFQSRVVSSLHNLLYNLLFDMHA